MPKGKLIVLEGIDTSGKTTQAKKLYDYLAWGRGNKVAFRLEPMERIDISQVDNYQCIVHFTKDRLSNLYDYPSGIYNLLDQGYNVILDRYILSTIAYQGVNEETKDYIRKLNSFVIIPDLTIFIDLDPEESINRLEARPHIDPWENIDFLKSVSANYKQEIADSIIKNHGTIKTIDGGLDAETIHQQIKDLANKVLSAKLP